MKNLKTIAFLFALFALAGTVLADGITKRIKFAKGRTSTVVSGAVIRGERDTYLIGAARNQTMSVRVAAAEKNAVFQIEAPDGTFVQGADEADDATNWRGELPATGDYKIIVGGTRGNASYKMTVSIK